MRHLIALGALCSFGFIYTGCSDDAAGDAGAGVADVGGGGGDITAVEDTGEADYGPTPGASKDGLSLDGADSEGEDADEPDLAEPDVEPDVAEEQDTFVPPDPPENPCAEAEDGTACDDDDPCTMDDACSFGECKGTAFTCTDGIGCTNDVCDGEGGCTFPLRGDRCLIDGACYEDGDAGPTGCMACVVPISQTEWTADDSLQCEDGNFCTEGEFCFGGECIGGSPKDCDDQNWCTDDGCTINAGCTHAPNERFCDDGDACTLHDTCVNGLCLPGPGALCDDQNNCTLDYCFFGTCSHDPATGPCDDGDTCTIGDECTEGECVSGPPLSCTDGNPCTDNLCHPEAGCVTKFNNGPCSDGNPCTAGDMCAFGTCQTGVFNTICNDANICTTDFCDPVSGECAHVPVNGVVCTDGNPCTVGDFCEAGTCKSGGQTVNCNDDNECTDDLCGPDGNCVFANNVIPCDDGDPCTKGDKCQEGLCSAGTSSVNCTDLNPCTDDWCEPGEGCKNVPNSILCVDGDACTVGDKCVNGQCVPGSSGAACDDNNPCTDDQCASDKGCVNFPNTAFCDDGEACTISDQCEGGVCLGENGDCDDGNECTKEICLAGGGCDHVPINTFECKPQIVFINPPRGAMLMGPQPVFVTGYVSVGGAGLKDFFINDLPVEVDPVSGAFTHIMEPEVGLNVIHAIANSKLGGQDKAIRSFAWSTKYHPSGGMIPAGIGLWLSQAVWDDNNTSDIDDIATVITLILESFDLPSLIPNPLAETGALHCDFTVKAQPVFIGQPSVDLITKNQALGVSVRYPNLFVGLDVDADGFLCPGVSGSVTASYVEVSVDMVITGNGNGVDITMANPNVTIASLDVDIDGILGFLFNWIINFFEGDLASAMEDLVIDQLSIIPDTLGDALGALAINQEFELPALIGDGEATTLTLSSVLSGADFDQFGGFLELGTQMEVSQKKVPYATLGSLARDKCGSPDADFFDYLMQSEIEIALKDDMINQMLYSAWYAGAFEIPLPVSFLGDVDLSEYGVEIIDVGISFLLPPILSSCNYDDILYMGLGDLKVTASLILFGSPLTVTAYASGIIAAEMVVIEGLDGNELGIELEDVVLFDVEVQDVSAGFEGAQGAVEELIGQFLAPDLLTSLGGDALGSIPIPSIPLDGFDESIPSGTTLSLSLQKIYRLGGRTVMAGNAQ